jgi:translation initiation factor IF-3
VSYPHVSRNQGSPSSFVRVNGKIRAREVRVIGLDGKQLGILSLGDAINLARSQGVDLVEIAANANPPVCRVVDYGKFRYEQSKRDRESKKHQHANRVKEVQLSPNIDQHDFGVKLGHAVDFLCEEMKVKVTLRFRGREMMHQEFGFQVVRKFITEVTPWGHPDSDPKLVGRGIHLMLSPLPRNKRAKHPREIDGKPLPQVLPREEEPRDHRDNKNISPSPVPLPSPQPQMAGAQSGGGGFSNNPFEQLEGKFGG